MIRVVNIGNREAQITNIGWKVGLFGRQNAIQTTSNDGMSSSIPVRLKDGEEANYYIPLTGTNWLENFAREFLRSFPEIRSRFIKVQVFTSVGRIFEERIEKGLREMVVKAAKNLPGN